MTATMAKIKQMNPDAVLLVSYLSDAVLITKTMKELGINAPIVGTSAGHIDPAYISTLGKDADYTFTVGEWATDVKKKGVVEISKRFKEKFGVDMNGHAAETYMSTYVLADALEEQARLIVKSSEMLLQKRSFVAIKTFSPMIVYASPDWAISKAQLIIMQIIDGQHKTVWPFDAASASLECQFHGLPAIQCQAGFLRLNLDATWAFSPKALLDYVKPHQAKIS